MKKIKISVSELHETISEVIVEVPNDFDFLDYSSLWDKFKDEDLIPVDERPQDREIFHVEELEDES